MSAPHVDILWFLSLALSLISALAATLRWYLHLARAHTTLHERARARAYLFEGVQAFRLSQAVAAVPRAVSSSATYASLVAAFLRPAHVTSFLPNVRHLSGFLCFAMPVRPDGLQDDFAPTFCASCTRFSGRCPTRYDRNRRAIERRALRWVVATADDDDDDDIESLVEGTLPPEPAGTRLT
jgi:hypothetical protein